MKEVENKRWTPSREQICGVKNKVQEMQDYAEQNFNKCSESTKTSYSQGKTIRQQTTNCPFGLQPTETTTETVLRLYYMAFHRGEQGDCLNS